VGVQPVQGDVLDDVLPAGDHHQVCYSGQPHQRVVGAWGGLSAGEGEGRVSVCGTAEGCQVGAQGGRRQKVEAEGAGSCPRYRWR
jgi:hypothetical protein